MNPVDNLDPIEFSAAGLEPRAYGIGRIVFGTEEIDIAGVAFLAGTPNPAA